MYFSSFDPLVSAIKQPKVSDYKPPDFNETFGHPPDYAESTGIFECDSEGKSMLDNGSFLGSTSMFGSSMLNSRNDMRVVFYLAFNQFPNLKPNIITRDPNEHTGRV